MYHVLITIIKLLLNIFIYQGTSDDVELSLNFNSNLHNYHTQMGSQLPYYVGHHLLTNPLICISKHVHNVARSFCLLSLSKTKFSISLEKQVQFFYTFHSLVICYLNSEWLELGLCSHFCFIEFEIVAFVHVGNLTSTFGSFHAYDSSLC